MRMTVGPLAASVYWRRRAIVLGATLLVILLTMWACTGGSTDQPTSSGPSGGKSGAGGHHSASPGPSAPADGALSDVDGDGPEPGSPQPAAQQSGGAPPGSAPTGAAPPCGDSDLSVTTRTNHPRVPAGSYPLVYLTIRNEASHACTRDIGADQQELWIMHGTTRIWSSDDCDANHGTDIRRFESGSAVVFHLSWNSRTSSKGCHGTRREVGPGSYKLLGRLGSKAGKPFPFTLT